MQGDLSEQVRSSVRSESHWVSRNSHRTGAPNSKPNQNTAKTNNSKTKTQTPEPISLGSRRAAGGGCFCRIVGVVSIIDPQPKRKSNCWKSRVAKSKRRSKARQGKAKKKQTAFNENQSHHPSPTNKPRPKTALISPRAPTYQQLISILCSFCASAASSSYLLNPSSTSSLIPSKSSSLPAA
jgi:hypothetical protein